MTPTTTITAIAYGDFKSTPTTTTEVVSGAPLAKTAHVPSPLTAEVLAWLTRRLDWEDHLNRLHERQADNHKADFERG